MIRKRLLLLLVLVLSLSACINLADVGGDVTAEEEETSSVVVPGVPNLTVNQFAGKLTVRDGETDQITAHLTKRSRLDDEAEAQAQLDQIVMTFSQSGTDVTLDIEGPDEMRNIAPGLSAEIELSVPPGTELSLNLGAGEIDVEQPSGDVTVNGGAGETTVTLPADASFRLIATGGVAGVVSDFEGVPDGGVAADIDTTIGDNPTQTLTFNIGAGAVNLRKAP